METRVHIPEMEPPATMSEVMAALRKQKLEPTHDKKSWGDWINFTDYSTVISIECNRTLTSSATIEHDESDGDDIYQKILAAFAKLGWYGSDEEGDYRLD